MAHRIRVAVEAGSKRAFATAVDWPGWSRGAKSEAEALAALVAYGDRYRRVVSRSPGGFHAPDDVAGLEVVERPRGGSGTDFGVPGADLAADDSPLGGAELERQAAILRACWRSFDRAAEAAVGVVLRTGPRGGGRELEKISEHAVEAEEAYLRQLGARPPKGPSRAVGASLPADRWPDLREAMLVTLAARAGGEPPATQVKRPWSPRYFVRRAAWHVLDHAWEIEDRAAPEQA